MAALVQSGLVELLHAQERFLGRHLDVIAAPRVKGPVAAESDVGLGGGDCFLGRLEVHKRGCTPGPGLVLFDARPRHLRSIEDRKFPHHHVALFLVLALGVLSGLGDRTKENDLLSPRSGRNIGRAH